MLAVAGELVLRKRNLQVGFKDTEGNVSFDGMTLEDWINDWFVSLFDQRMSHAKLSLRDQKRGGHSASGKGPGEIDGFITSSDSRRVGIFEAFRLFSVDTTTIGDHLNKIAGYDGESLSPVVMVGYCDVKNFANLVKGYNSYVSNQAYTGYTISDGAPSALRVLHDVDHIWLASETRRRGGKDIVFYHLLINLHFSPTVEIPESGKQGASVPPVKRARRARTTQIYKNPHNGEMVETKSGNHKILKAWKGEYGGDVVKSWLVQ